MLEHKPVVFLSACVLFLVVVLTLGVSRLVGAQGEPPPAVQSVATDVCSDPVNMLANPCFNDGGFYFRMPNSLVPPKWYRWWDYGRDGPEFIDGGTTHHNQCYPLPASQGQSQCVDMAPKNRSLGYIRMGAGYTAGAWQWLRVTPCMDYQFSGYVRGDSTGYHPRLGINPLGQRMPLKPPEKTEYGCGPDPDGNSICYKEGLNWVDMPSATVWGNEIDLPPQTWSGPVTVTTEALSTTISVWTYTSPGTGSQSTYWDLMSLYQVPKKTLAQNGEIPAPDGTLNPTVTPGTTTAQVQWNTTSAALGQVFYRLHPTPPLSDTSHLTHTVYLPVIQNFNNCATDDFGSCTGVESATGSIYSVSLGGLRPGTAYDYVVMSRRLDGSTCLSSASVTGTFTTTTP